MSRSAKVRRFFGDGDHDFQLTIGEVEELQETLDCGLMITLQRCTDIHVPAIKAVLRLGLVGAGQRKEKAFVLVQRHVVPGYLVEVAAVAGEVVRAALQGAKDEDLGEQQGETATSPISPEESFASPRSMASEPPSDGTLRPSAERLSGSSAPPSRDGKRPTRSKTKPDP